MEREDFSDCALSERIDGIRRFERHYEHYLRKAHAAMACDELSVADMRVVHELGLADGGSGAWLAYRLGLDEGYLSRILRKLEAYDLVQASASAIDRRRKDWSLTKPGRELATILERDYRERVRDALLELHPEDQRRMPAPLVERAVGERLRLAAAGNAGVELDGAPGLAAREELAELRLR